MFFKLRNIQEYLNISTEPPVLTLRICKTSRCSVWWSVLAVSCSQDHPVVTQRFIVFTLGKADRLYSDDRESAPCAANLDDLLIISFTDKTRDH